VTLVRAAGGVVTREGPAGLEVVLVHRPAYDDWSFPKGKLEDGEDELACALREVEEECGIACEALEDLGSLAYVMSSGRPKVVRYWHMRGPEGAKAKARHEIDEARWVPLPDAEPMLTYPHDRTLLRRLAREPADGTPVPVYLVRHVMAGDRRRWRHEPDELRPISRNGLKQAKKLAATLAPLGLTRLVSSPYLRCTQTLQPLGAMLDLDILVASELAEEEPIAGVEAWIMAVASDGPGVLCSHGDPMIPLVESLIARGVPIGGDGTVAFRKGGTWRLDVLGGTIRKATYLPPPVGPRPPQSAYAV
jgi:8-oxo-dGTP diphosphatase